jgi:hypothetical protein
MYVKNENVYFFYILLYLAMQLQKESGTHFFQHTKKNYTTNPELYSQQITPLTERDNEPC